MHYAEIAVSIGSPQESSPARERKIRRSKRIRLKTKNMYIPTQPLTNTMHAHKDIKDKNKHDTNHKTSIC
jgi:hypothetical protein